MKWLRIVVVFFVIGLCASCNKNDEVQTLSGVYTETEPVSGRSQLNFINENLVVRIEVESLSEETFNYEIEGGVIRLTSIVEPYLTNELELRIINDSQFEIENLYGSIGIAPKTYMTYAHE